MAPGKTVWKLGPTRMLPTCQSKATASPTTAPRNSERRSGCGGWVSGIGKALLGHALPQPWGAGPHHARCARGRPDRFGRRPSTVVLALAAVLLAHVLAGRLDDIIAEALVRQRLAHGRLDALGIATGQFAQHCHGSFALDVAVAHAQPVVLGRQLFVEPQQGLAVFVQLALGPLLDQQPMQ